MLIIYTPTVMQFTYFPHGKLQTVTERKKSGVSDTFLRHFSTEIISTVKRCCPVQLTCDDDKSWSRNMIFFRDKCIISQLCIYRQKRWTIFVSFCKQYYCIIHYSIWQISIYPVLKCKLIYDILLIFCPLFCLITRTCNLQSLMSVVIYEKIQFHFLIDIIKTKNVSIIGKKCLFFHLCQKINWKFKISSDFHT